MKKYLKQFFFDLNLVEVKTVAVFLKLFLVFLSILSLGSFLVMPLTIDSVPQLRSSKIIIEIIVTTNQTCIFNSNSYSNQLRELGH